MTEDEGVVDLPLRCDWPNRPRQIAAPDGKPARSRWRVIGRETAATRVALTPVTGRSHQLRVHMATLGHPILGDAFYGDPVSAPRLMLHAERLGFKDPETGAPVEVIAPSPF